MARIRKVNEKVLLLIPVIVVFLTAALWRQPPYTPNDSFNLLFRQGVGAKNELDTFNGTYTKDLIMNPPITTRLALSEQELVQIYQRMISIGFFNYSESFPPRYDYCVTPSSSYYLKVENGSITKEVSWDSNSNLGSTFQDLYGLVDLIQSTVEQKIEYKMLPQPYGGYE